MKRGALVAFVSGIAVMILVKLFSPLAWTWYVLVGTLVTYAIGTLASTLISGSTSNGRKSDATVQT